MGEREITDADAFCPKMTLVSPMNAPVDTWATLAHPEESSAFINICLPFAD